MGSLHNADDSAFGAALSGVRRKFDQNLIAMHCLRDVEGRDENITIKARASLAIQGADEAEAVAMHGEGSGDKIAIDGCSGDCVAVARDQHKFAANDEVGEQRFQFLALAATYGEFADKLLVSGGMLRLVVNV
jgi:hypothetical protein